MWLQGQHQTQARFTFKLQLSSAFLPSNIFLLRVLTVNFVFIPGGGDVKIESHKLNIKAKSKIGSLDNVGLGNGQTNGHKVKLLLDQSHCQLKDHFSLCFCWLTVLLLTHTTRWCANLRFLCWGLVSLFFYPECPRSPLCLAAGGENRGENIFTPMWRSHNRTSRRY